MNNDVSFTMRMSKIQKESLDRICKKMNLTKAQFIRQMLDEIIPVLDSDNGNLMMRNLFFQASKHYKELGGLFDEKSKENI